MINIPEKCMINNLRFDVMHNMKSKVFEMAHRFWKKNEFYLVFKYFIMNFKNAGFNMTLMW
jgi:hypothetical protein